MPSSFKRISSRATADSKKKRARFKPKFSDTVNAVRKVVGNIPESSRTLIDTLDKCPHRLKQWVENQGGRRSPAARVVKRLVRVLITLTTALEWSTSRIGIAKKDCLDPITHNSLMARYQKMWGQPMPRSTWYRYIRDLVDAGYINSQAMNVLTKDKEIRGEPSYKWFTEAFFMDLNLSGEWLENQRDLAMQRLLKSGLSNCWVTYQSKTSKTRRSSILTLESYQTGVTRGLFDTDNGYAPPH
ncbi:hypothetical protein ACP6H1_27500 [Vibrio harveyi]|uniref:hypothetical protein n=1 Tax=Vibrio harveyi TaxID=669 RepID=UPI003CE7B236